MGVSSSLRRSNDQSYSAQLPANTALRPPVVAKTRNNCRVAATQSRLSGADQNDPGTAFQARCSKWSARRARTIGVAAPGIRRSHLCQVTLRTSGNDVRPIAWTSYPCETSSGSVCRPMKPLAPVTRTRIFPEKFIVRVDTPNIQSHRRAVDFNVGARDCKFKNSNDLQARNRHYEVAAPGPNVGHSVQHLVLQVPGQNE